MKWLRDVIEDLKEKGTRIGEETRKAERNGQKWFQGPWSQFFVEIIFIPNDTTSRAKFTLIKNPISAACNL